MFLEHLGDAVKTVAQSEMLQSQSAAFDNDRRGSDTAKVSTLGEVHQKRTATERCVVCSCDTGISIFAGIDRNPTYVDGAGQLCLRCFQEVST